MLYKIRRVNGHLVESAIKFVTLRLISIKAVEAMEIKTYHTISDFNREHGLTTLHPLIHVCKMDEHPDVFIEGNYSFDCYQIYLNDNYTGTIRYGRNNYDYQNGTLMFVAPRQVVREDGHEGTDQGWVLMFHPDFLSGTVLGRGIHNYSFFQYDVNEALRLSEEEHDIIESCFKNLLLELHHATDDNSKPIIISYLELLLNYSKRFYERQFITRSQGNNDFLSRFERMLDDYFKSGQLLQHGIPTVKWCADNMNLSANYLTDMLRKYTGKSAMEHIQSKVIETAKDSLLYHREKTVNEIAYELGFEYPQYFCRLFKKRVGVSPNEYRYTAV